ncbi:MAG: hypothetical protein EPO08_20620 [Rhodospirillaceae bacterium]|nr:MAG: hypothetical protein EPO08_20620 [Rhodospirillaceae bacterium]
MNFFYNHILHLHIMKRLSPDDQTDECMVLWLDFLEGDPGSRLVRVQITASDGSNIEVIADESGSETEGDILDKLMLRVLGKTKDTLSLWEWKQAGDFLNNPALRQL